MCVSGRAISHCERATGDAAGRQVGEAREAFPMEAIEYLRMQSGAATVILFDGYLEVGSPLTLSEEQQATILDRLTSTPSEVTNGVGDIP